MEHNWHESHSKPLNERAYGYAYPDDHQHWGFPAEVIERWPPLGVIEQWWYLEKAPEEYDGAWCPDTNRVQGRLYNAEHPLGTGINTSKWVKMGHNYVVTRNSVYLLGEPHPMMVDGIREDGSVGFTNDLDHWLNAICGSTENRTPALAEAQKVITEYARANPLGMWDHLDGDDEDTEYVVTVNVVGYWDYCDTDGRWLNGVKRKATWGVVKTA